MSAITTALAGAHTFRQLIKNEANELVLIIPDFDVSLTNALADVFFEYIDSRSIKEENVCVCFSDSRVKEILEERNVEKVWFNFISEKKMKRLTGYVLLTSKQYGSSWSKKIKIVSLDAPYAGQVRKVVEQDIFPLQSIVKDILLARE